MQSPTFSSNFTNTNKPKRKKRQKYVLCLVEKPTSKTSAQSRSLSYVGCQLPLDYFGSSDKTHTTTVVALARFFFFLPHYSQFSSIQKASNKKPESSIRCGLDSDDSKLGNSLNMQAQTQRRLQTFEAHTAFSSTVVEP